MPKHSPSFHPTRIWSIPITADGVCGFPLARKRNYREIRFDHALFKNLVHHCRTPLHAGTFEDVRYASCFCRAPDWTGTAFSRLSSSSRLTGFVGAEGRYENVL